MKDHHEEYEHSAAARIDAAIAELKGLIEARFPDAVFAVAPGEDPPGIYVMATVDVADVDEVFEVVVERLLEIQVDEALPIYVIPVRPLKRVIADLLAETPQSAPILLPHGLAM